MTHSDFRGGKIKFDVFNHQILSEGAKQPPFSSDFRMKKESPEMLLWHVTECK